MKPYQKYWTEGVGALRNCFVSYLCEIVCICGQFGYIWVWKQTWTCPVWTDSFSLSVTSQLGKHPATETQRVAWLFSTVFFIFCFWRSKIYPIPSKGNKDTFDCLFVASDAEPKCWSKRPQKNWPWNFGSLCQRYNEWMVDSKLSSQKCHHSYHDMAWPDPPVICHIL